MWFLPFLFSLSHTYRSPEGRKGRTLNYTRDRAPVWSQALVVRDTLPLPFSGGTVAQPWAEHALQSAIGGRQCAQQGHARVMTGPVCLKGSPEVKLKNADALAPPLTHLIRIVWREPRHLYFRKTSPWILKSRQGEKSLSPCGLQIVSSSPKHLSGFKLFLC